MKGMPNLAAIRSGKKSLEAMEAKEQEVIEGNKLIAEIESLGYEIHPNGDIYVHRKMKLSVGNAGYKMVNVAKGKARGQYKTHSVHRIIAMKYIPNPNNLPEVNHKDGNKLNNDVSNLEWCNRSENIRHRHKIQNNQNQLFK